MKRFPLYLWALSLSWLAHAAHGSEYCTNDTECHLHSNAMSLLQHHSRKQSCPSTAPEINGTTLDKLIENNKGLLMIAMPNMKCTLAAKSALEAKGAAFKLVEFTADFQYQQGKSNVWDWLHCHYQNDKQGDIIMHSYVFLDQDFLGQGFAAAQKIQQGKLDDRLGATDCTQLTDGERSKNIVDNMLKSGPVVMLGWLGCPCVQTVQTRFASKDLCVKERTWANPTEPLMSYLQCMVKDSNSHSFVFFRQEDGTMKFVGNGFAFADDAMDDSALNKLIADAGAKTACHRGASNETKNIYNGALEECRVGTDPSGSWEDDGTCTEKFGGVHQICLEQIPADFSEATGQSPWSRERAGKRHCVCIGAWSLYMTKKQENPVLPHCKSIPSTVFTSTYIQNWKDWNGIPASIKKGVEELVERCLTAKGLTEEEKCGLKSNFESLKANDASLSDVDPAGLSDLSC